MIVLDGTVVNTAIPTIRTGLGFSNSLLVWIVDAYLLTYASFFLLGARFGARFGERRTFLGGMVLFTFASLWCGVAWRPDVLLVGRAVQGVGSALVSAVMLSLTLSLFPAPHEGIKAMGIYGFVNIGGQSIGLLVGGIITSLFSWRWIFLVNIPTGIAIYALGRIWLPDVRRPAQHGGLDISGATFGVAALMLLAYAITNAQEHADLSVFKWGVSAVALFIIFLNIEKRAAIPIIPLGLFRRRNLALAAVAGALCSAALYVWYVFATLYLQLILGYSPLRASLLFIPASAITALLSLGPFARLLTIAGTKPPSMLGLLFAATGLAWLARAPVDGSPVVDVLPAMILLGLGGGTAYSQLLLAGVADLAPEEVAVGSSVMGTSSIIGGALGLAAVSNAASARTEHLLTLGTSSVAALTSGYHTAFSLATILVILAVFGVAFLRPNITNQLGLEAHRSY